MFRARRLHPIVVVCLLLFSTACATAPAVTTKKVDHPRHLDGVYEGSSMSGPVKVRVRVSIEDQRISNIQLIEHSTWKGKEAEAIIPDRIVQGQSTEVNVVSGATRSSRVIMNAVQNAVDKAMKK